MDLWIWIEDFDGGRTGIRGGMVQVGHFVFPGPKVQNIYSIVIRDLTLIAADVQFDEKDHSFRKVGIPMRIAPPDFDALDCDTIFGSEVQIGHRFTIFHGGKICRGSVVADIGVVTWDPPKYSVAAGTPAKAIRRYFKSTREETVSIFLMISHSATGSEWDEGASLSWETLAQKRGSRISWTT